MACGSHRDRSPHKAARERTFADFEALADFELAAWRAAPADEIAKLPHFCFDDEAQAVFIE